MPDYPISPGQEASAAWASAVWKRATPAFKFVGELSGLALLGTYDRLYLPDAFTIAEILLFCGKTPAAGSITVELFKQDTPGGAVTSLYTTNTKPSLSSNGGANWATFTGANLPNTLTVAANSLLLAKITAAPLGSGDLEIYVR